MSLYKKIICLVICFFGLAVSFKGMATTVRKAYDFNGDDIPETLLYVDFKMNLRVIDENRDGRAESFFIETRDKIIDWNQMSGYLTLISFSRTTKTVLKYRITESTRVDLKFATLEPLKLYHFGVACNSAADEISQIIPPKPILDATIESNLDRLKSKSCSEDQSRIIKDQFKDLFSQSYFSKTNNAVRTKCLKNIAKTSFEPTKVYQLLQQKLEIIKQGSSFLNVECPAD